MIRGTRSGLQRSLGSNGVAGTPSGVAEARSARRPSQAVTGGGQMRTLNAVRIQLAQGTRGLVEVRLGRSPVTDAYALSDRCVALTSGDELARVHPEAVTCQ
jgi:hypothetical protein